MSVPEVVTPWLTLVSTSIGTAIALAAALLWLRRKAAQAWRDAVMDVVHPLKEEVAGISKLVQLELTTNGGSSMKDRVRATFAMAEQTKADLEAQTKRVEDRLTTRSAITDGKFESLERRMSALEQRQTRDTQKVIEAVEAAAPPPAAGDGGA